MRPEYSGSIAALGREAWNRCFPGDPENYDYFLAVETAGIPGFTLGYYALFEGGALMAAAPAFFTQYDLATTAEGWVRTALSGIKRAAPSLVTLTLACLGSPVSEHCPIGMHPSCNAEKKRELFGQLLAFFEEDAQVRGAALTALKDVSDDDKARYGGVLSARGFHCAAGMPTAASPIDFASIDDYFLRLSAATRKDVRRKLKKREALRIEYRRNIDDVMGDVMQMYRETKSRSDWEFEELTPEYFRGVLQQMGDTALCTLYFAGESPIGANLMLVGGNCLLDKFFCMRSDQGRAHNLYFISWITNLQFCLDHGLQIYQSGQAGYDTKLRLASGIRPNWMYFRHRHRMADLLLRLAAPLLAFKAPEKKPRRRQKNRAWRKAAA